MVALGGIHSTIKHGLSHGSGRGILIGYAMSHSVCFGSHTRFRRMANPRSLGRQQSALRYADSGPLGGIHTTIKRGLSHGRGRGILIGYAMSHSVCFGSHTLFRRTANPESLAQQESALRWADWVRFAVALWHNTTVTNSEASLWHYCWLAQFPPLVCSSSLPAAAQHGARGWVLHPPNATALSARQNLHFVPSMEHIHDIRQPAKI